MKSDEQDSDSFADETSLSLLNGARLQDAIAWQRLARYYEPLIESWCRISRVPAADIPDIKQDVLAAVWKNLGAFRKSKRGDTFRGWLKTITRNKIRDHFRKQQAASQLPLENVADILPEEDSETNRVEVRELFFRALQSIRPEFERRTWEAFWLTVVEGNSAVDAAGKLSVSADSVRQSKSRVLKRLRSELGDVGPGAATNAQSG